MAKRQEMVGIVLLSAFSNMKSRKISIVHCLWLYLSKVVTLHASNYICVEVSIRLLLFLSAKVEA